MIVQKYPQEWRTKLVGVTFQGRQDTIQQYVKNGQQLFFKHNGSNEFDSNAIEVYVDQAGNKMIGHLNKKMAAHTVKRIAEDVKHSIFCEQVTGKDEIGRSLGVNIRIIARK